MTKRKLAQLLEEKNALELELKARSMVFQVEAKEEMAKLFNCPLKTFYHWSYPNWLKLSNHVEAMRNEAYKAWTEKADVTQFIFLRKKRNVTMGQIWSAYFEHLDIFRPLWRQEGLPALYYIWIYSIKQLVERRAWTGGDTPPKGFSSVAYEELVELFYKEQIAVSGLDLWQCAGTTAHQRSEIFKNHARLDAWRTLNH